MLSRIVRGKSKLISSSFIRGQRTIFNARPSLFLSYSNKFSNASFLTCSPSLRRFSTFVSQHYRINEDQIVSYLDRKGFIYKSNQNEFIIRECCFCEKPTNNKMDNLYKLYISKETGSFFCHRCGAKGSWFDFKSRLGDIQQNVIQNTSTHSTPSAPAPSVIDSSIYKGYVEDLLIHHKYPQILNHLLDTSPQGRCLTINTLRKYCVGAKMNTFVDDQNHRLQEECILFPWIELDANNQPIIHRYKSRSLIHKAHMRLDPVGGSWGLFGWHTIPKKALSLVITEGEFDAMAVYQATGIPAVSLPNGAQSLPVQILPMLERFETIYLWMDFDRTGQENAEKFANKMGRGRVKIVHPPLNGPPGVVIKDACDALRYHLDIRQMIESATLLPHSQIMTFKELKEDLYYDIMHPNELKGIPYLTLPFFNKTLKGHRKGELSILTGPTGSGKTTLLSQLSLDLVRQGVPTLWGSFEIPNRRLSHVMLRQYSGRQLSADLSKEEFDDLANKFSTLPLYFLKFFGSTQVDQVIDAMEYAVYAYDVEHIILDNLQFMLGTTFKGYEKFDAQEMAIQAFRRFATQQNVHITLVIHPRKEADDTSLNISSVFGTAKATQEADNVIILQNTLSSHKVIEIKKNRFDGELGACELEFDKNSLLFHEISSTIGSIPQHSESVMANSSFSRRFPANNNNFKSNQPKSIKSMSFRSSPPKEDPSSDPPTVPKQQKVISTTAHTILTE